MKKIKTISKEPTELDKAFAKMIKKAAKELAADIKDATAIREELNPNVILAEGWNNFLGSVEKNMVEILPVILEYFKKKPELLDTVLLSFLNPVVPLFEAYKRADGLDDRQAVRDMMTDMVHLADEKKLNIYEITNVAVDVAKEEDYLNKPEDPT